MMIKALAPRLPRGSSWVWLSIALCGGFPAVVAAQAPKTAPEPASKKAAAPAAASKKAAAPAVEEEPVEEEKKATPVEIYSDPRAAEALAIYRSAGRACLPADIKAAKDMAGGGATVDRDAINKFVDGMVAELTSKTNLTALVNPGPGKVKPAAAHAVQDAVDNLLEPLLKAKGASNKDFLSIYNKALIDKLPALLNNHLIARIEAMIVLAQTGSPEALEIFVKVLNDRKQTAWVKLWAARGLDNIVSSASGNRVDETLGPKAIAASKALADALEAEKDLPWPVQVRMLEALGSMRLSAAPASPAKADMATAAVQLLCNAEARPEVRVEAASALGMMRVTPGTAKYNFALVAYNIGEVSADLAERIVEVYEENPIQAKHWVGLLVYKLYPSMYGDTAKAKESGLLNVGNHPNYGPSKEYLRQVSEQVKGISQAAVDLIQQPKAKAPQFLEALSSKAVALRAFLDKNPPADKRLVPLGREFPVRAAVARAVEGRAAVAGGAR